MLKKKNLAPMYFSFLFKC